MSAAKKCFLSKRIGVSGRFPAIPHPAGERLMRARLFPDRSLSSTAHQLVFRTMFLDFREPPYLHVFQHA